MWSCLRRLPLWHQLHLLLPVLLLVPVLSAAVEARARFSFARLNTTQGSANRKIPCSSFYHSCKDAEAKLCARYGYDPVFKGHSGCVALIRNHITQCEKRRKAKADKEKESLQDRIDQAYKDIEQDLDKSFLAWSKDFEREDKLPGSGPAEAEAGAAAGVPDAAVNLLLGGGGGTKALSGRGGGSDLGALDDLRTFEAYCEQCREGDPSDPFDNRHPGWELICKCKNQFSYIALTHEQAHALGCGK